MTNEEAQELTVYLFKRLEEKFTVMANGKIYSCLEANQLLKDGKLLVKDIQLLQNGEMYDGR